MRTDNLPKAIAAASRIPFSPDLRLGITTRREAGSVAPGLSAPLAAQAAGGSSSMVAGHGVGPYSPGSAPVCPRKSDRGVMPDDRSESGVESSDSSPSRIDQIGACACILIAIACVLFDAPYWVGQLLIAWGWV